MRYAVLLPLLALATPVTAQRYLTGPGISLGGVLPPAPVAGLPEDAADRATFRTTRGQLINAIEVDMKQSYGLLYTYKDRVANADKRLSVFQAIPDDRRTS